MEEINHELPKQRSKLKRFLAIGLPILAFIAAAAFLFWPQPYYIEQPGITMPLSDMITVKGKKAESKGDFYLTAVTIAPANNAMILASKFNSFAEVVLKEEMTGGLSNKEYNVVNQFYMETAQNMAVYQAFKLANRPYTMKYEGVYVLSITKDSTFKKDLQIADTLTAVNGQHFKSSKEMMDYIAKQQVGEPVSIDVTRMDGTKHTFKGNYIQLKDEKGKNTKTGIGIGLTDHTTVETDPKVKIDAGSIGGPSAGMMFTLEVYDQLTDSQLLKGRKIAGTGTIEDDGSVGQIGGVDKKVASASKNGAAVFLAPDSGSKKA
ncbi:MAG: PDZ domain-containing protein, partial [Streptococcaceae bacterium]|nr:PDZ domain-containing protein [Streptococcaceae bacterium]